MPKKVNSLLNQRLKAPQDASKMVSLVEHTADGRRSGLATAFGVTDLETDAKEALRALLETNALGVDCHVDKDLAELITLTAEVRAIHRQAALLHGERIRKAQSLLKGYQEGTFTSWLIATYGNRQTPYNFLQYYEFYKALPKSLHKRLEQMPLQAVYTLASRDAPLMSKRALVEQYQGETKNQLLALIREAFPLPETDQRRQSIGAGVVATLENLFDLVSAKRRSITKKYRREASALLDELRELLEP